MSCTICMLKKSSNYIRVENLISTNLSRYHNTIWECCKYFVHADIILKKVSFANKYVYVD